MPYRRRSHEGIVSNFGIRKFAQSATVANSSQIEVIERFLFFSSDFDVE